ncbi:amino acid ABC transporter permease [Streptococcus uberis]|uniref:Amino acid ABC transporter, permease protein n=2 Tax=Streptococcus uberis TaxID=1349 RepID=B9DU21_STRU0|nr:amino acid ABC transporter permease [Streptococcus uberis]AUC24650.1 amino acid ABC transporter permease [Streptococcus uberis]KKF42620.1 glutamine ABC transporter permease [Streptococcus uberis C9359]KKF43633.1 glutamine ABC transporter permease [Streptococcus uberis EF20/0145]KKF44641.1 glutamine ABC transporter permease [Streptococcus uberis Ab71]KKF46405.1 glutamine ABC transporter permease [Streptococcus uberis C8329]
MAQLFTPSNLSFILEGLGLTLYISLISIVLSTIFGTFLAIMRNGKNTFLKLVASIYIEFVRNVPNLLWIFIIFLVFQMKSTPAGITAFTVFTSAALAEIIRGGLNGVDAGQTEAGLAQGFSASQVFLLIVFPQAYRKMLPAIISQFVTVIKDTSLLYSVIAIQELFGKSQILMGKYFQAEQVFALYALITFIYFVINFIISSLSRRLAKKWAQAN